MIIRQFRRSVPPDAWDQEHGSVARSMAWAHRLPTQISSACAWQHGLKGTISAGLGRGGSDFSFSASDVKI